MKIERVDSRGIIIAGFHVELINRESPESDRRSAAGGDVGGDDARDIPRSRFEFESHRIFIDDAGRRLTRRQSRISRDNCPSASSHFPIIPRPPAPHKHPLSPLSPRKPFAFTAARSLRRRRAQLPPGGFRGGRGGGAFLPRDGVASCVTSGRDIISSLARQTTSATDVRTYRYRFDKSRHARARARGRKISRLTAI